MLKALMKVRLASLKEMYFAGAKGKNSSKAGEVSKGRIVLIAVLFFYVFAVFAVMFFGLFSSLAQPFYAAGLSWLYFAMYSIISFAIMFIGSVFTAKAQLFEAKDNDLLLSMPVKTSYILFSRIATLWIINAVFGLLVAVPAALAWCINCPVNAWGVISYIVLSFLLTVFTVAIASLFGWLISLLTRRMRNKTLLTTVFSLGFLILYFVLINRANSIVEQLALNGSVIAQKMGSVFILVWIGQAMAGESIKTLLFSAVCLVAPFVLAYLLLNATFIKTITAKQAVAKRQYRAKNIKQKSPLAALVGRESSRFFASSVYILNAGLGVVFQVAAGVAMLFYMPKFMASIGEYDIPVKYICPALAALIALMTSMTDISSASVSMEGKNIWISKMLPVETKSILLSKVLFHLYLAMPASIISSVCVAIAAKASVLEAVVIIVFPAVFAVFAALLGVSANLRFPNLKWDNEAQAVKTGASVFIGMFGTMGALIAAAAAAIGLSFVIDINIAALIASVLVAAGCAMLYNGLMKNGVKRYNEL